MVINGAIVSDLDMMYIESVLQVPGTLLYRMFSEFSNDVFAYFLDQLIICTNGYLINI